MQQQVGEGDLKQFQVEWACSPKSTVFNMIAMVRVEVQQINSLVVFGCGILREELNV